MNVGSILNDEPESYPEPPTPVNQTKTQARQRNSIVSLLNDDKTPTPENEPPSATGSSLKEEISHEENGSSTEKSIGEPEQTDKSTSPNPNASATPQADTKDEDEISRLNRLKLRTKPKRYTVPPVWAQEWHGTSTKNEAEPLQISEKSIFNSSTTSVDLECSITGIIPSPSVTRRIAEWIYANFLEIQESNRKHVELELKFGTIMDKKTSNRINISVSTECVYTDVSNIYFEAGVHQLGFQDMLGFFEELEKSYQEDLKTRPSPGKPRRKFNIFETDVTDSSYFVRNRNEQPKTIRISKDNLLTPPRYTAINKQKISHLFIHNPSSMYDMRLTLALENPVTTEEMDNTMKKSKPNSVRIKQRNSFNHKPTVTQFDLTRVTTPKESKNTSTGKKVVESEKTYEVELEIDTVELFNGFDMFKTGTNSIRFEELVEIFINNARCLNNRVTKLAK